MTDEVESAAQVIVGVQGREVTVSELDTTKEIDVEKVYGSNSLLPSGYSIKSIDHSGAMVCKGNKKELEAVFFDPRGKPIPGVITVIHMDGSRTDWYEVIVVSEGYQLREGEVTQTSFDWVAMSKDGDAYI